MPDRVRKVRCAMTSADSTERPFTPPPRTPTDTPLNQVVFLTVAEVADVMRVSKMTVYRLVHSGELPAIRVGRSFRVPAQAVQDYVRGSYVASA